MMIMAACAGMTAAQEYPEPIERFGVQGHFGRHSWDFGPLLPFMRKMGVSWIKDEIYWHQVETEKGRYAIDEVNEAWIRQATDAGIRLIFSLTYGNHLYENPLDPDAYANWCRFMAAHFRGRIDVWEIWNEPQNMWFRAQYGGQWNGAGESPWVEKFAEMVEKASKAVREGNPEAVIISSGGSPPATHHLLNRFGERLVELDGLAEHPYPFRLPPETMPYGGPEILARDGVATVDDDHSFSSLIRRLRELGRKIDDDPSIWITEVGYTTYLPGRGVGLSYGFTPEAQAAYLVRMVVQSLTAEVSAVCVYDLMNDGPDLFESEHNFGLLDHAMQPKPAVEAFARLASMLGGGHEVIDAPAALECLPAEPPVGDAWQTGPEESFSPIQGPQCHWFRTKRGLVSLYWRAGRYNRETNGPLVRFVWPEGGEIKEVETTDLVTGGSIRIGVAKQDESWRTEPFVLDSNPRIIAWPQECFEHSDQESLR